jgi:hypothetical protein
MSVEIQKLHGPRIVLGLGPETIGPGLVLLASVGLDMVVAAVPYLNSVRLMHRPHPNSLIRTEGVERKFPITNNARIWDVVPHHSSPAGLSWVQFIESCFLQASKELVWFRAYMSCVLGSVSSSRPVIEVI